MPVFYQRPVGPNDLYRLIMKKILNIKNFDLILIIFLIAWGIFKVIKSDRHDGSEQQFIFLAKSFLQHKLYFTSIPGYWGDTAFFNGQHFWPLGPLPAFLDMPFVLFINNFQQHTLVIILNMINLLLLFLIAKKIIGRTTDSLWLAGAYVFSSAYLYIALKPWSWYYSQVLVTTLILLALLEFFNKRRMLLIGAWIGLAVMTRVNIILSLIFFLPIIWLTKTDRTTKIKETLKLLLPIGLALILLMIYNFYRFGNVFEFGYSYQLLYGEPARNFSQGMWSFIHFPANLYYFLLKGPDPIFLAGTKILTYPFLQPDIWGMSILFTSPIFLWIFSKPFKNRETILAAITSLVILFFLLGYYGIGVRQYGYRYALDFYPFLFIILAYASKEKVPLLFKIVAIAAALFNFFLIPRI